MRMHILMRLHIQIYVCGVCAVWCVCICMCVYANMCVCVYVSVYARMHVYTYMYLCVVPRCEFNANESCFSIHFQNFSINSWAEVPAIPSNSTVENKLKYEC